MSVLFDAQGIQSPAHGERGIARYLLELALALERRSDRPVGKYLLNRDLPVPGAAEPLLATDRVTFSDRVDGVGARVLHAASPFERVEIDRIWPAWARAGGARLVVTLYDLIPEVFADTYLADPATRRWYRGRLDLVRCADRVLAISEATARDAIERLGLAPERVVVVGAGVSDRFSPPASRTAALAAARAAVAALEPGYVLYTGGIDFRKNVDRLLQAYALLPRALTDAHQLVVVCRVRPDERAALAARLRALGIGARVLFPGYVSDEALVALYQACALFVFPSLYEGYGLPVAEAIACGAPVVSATTSSLVELVDDPDALFDPRDPEAIASALARALADEGLRTRLGARTLPSAHRWDAVAARTAAVYSDLARLPARPRRRRPRVAWVSPLPPMRSGIAEHSYRLLAALARHCDLDAFVDDAEGAGEAPSGVPVRPLARFEWAERARGGYDRVVICMGNSEYHMGALALLRRRPAVVLAHEVRLTGLYGWAARHRPELVPHGLRGALWDMYGPRLPPEVGASGYLDVDEYDRYGVLMAREAIALAERYLVHSRYAAQLARLEAAPDDVGKVAALPFATVDPREFDPYPRAPEGSERIASFGLVARVKGTPLVLEAFASLAARRPRATLELVGPLLDPADRVRLDRRAAELGLGGRVRVTGDLPEADFLAAIASASVAVQLRAASNGESSATVAQCLAAGVPTLVSALGPARELPDAAVAKVPRDASPATLAAALEAVLDDPARRARMQAAGLAWARERSFARVAELLYETALAPGAGRRAR